MFDSGFICNLPFFCSVLFHCEQEASNFRLFVFMYKVEMVTGWIKARLKICIIISNAALH